MRILMLTVLGAVLSPFVCLAADSVGRLTASDGVRLDGVYMPSAGVPSWPVHEGSVIQTGAYRAIVLLGGGGRLDVAPNSTAIVETSAMGPTLRVLESASSSAATTQLASSSSPAQVRTQSSVPTVAATPEISVVDDDNKGELGDPPAGPPCSGFPPILVTLGLVNCTP